MFPIQYWDLGSGARQAFGLTHRKPSHSIEMIKN